MSYILDALKKADAQRERDPARGIHAQPAPLPTLQQPGLGQRPWLWAAAAVAMAALAGAGWFLAQDRADLQRAPVATSDAEAARGADVPAAPPPGTTAPAPERVADAVLPPPAPVAPPVGAAAQGRGAAPAREKAAPAAPAAKSPPAPGAPATVPAPAVPPALAPAAVTVAPAPAPAPAPAAVRPTARALAAAPASAAAVSEAPIVNGLPPEAPRLAISGGVYSASRAQRMLIVNGQVVNEGADLGGGIVLEEIRPKAAVLRFRGGRYKVGF